MTKFEIGKVYGMNSICDSDCWWYYRVEARTNSTVTLRQLKSDGTEYSETIKCKINAKRSEIYGAEAVRPLGTYSMCPTLTAEKVIENLGAMAKLNKAFLEAYDNYYDNGDEGDFDEMLSYGMELTADKELDPLLCEFASYRHDILTSDRELAAFAKAYIQIYKPEPKAKVVKMEDMDKMLYQLIEQKCQPAFDKMTGFKRCEELYNMMAKESPKLAEAFKNMCWCCLVLHPDWTEQDFLESFYNKMYNK